MTAAKSSDNSDTCWTLVVFCLILHTAHGSTLRKVHFREDTACPGRVVNVLHCPKILQATSKVQCAVLCSQRPACFTFIWDSNLQQCRLCDTTPMLDCANTEASSLKAYRMTVTPESCQNGGSYNVSAGRCHCPAGFAGDWCQRRILDCFEGSKLGNPKDVYDLQPALSPEPFSVYCTASGENYISWRPNNNLLFNRTWQEYRDGFGDPLDIEWMGLEHIYRMTNSGMKYTLTIKIERSVYYQQHFYNFSLTGEADNYRMHFDSTAGNVSDSLSSSRGAPFSTYDADHDGDATVNCAQRHHIGWWFPVGNCSRTECNPLGTLCSQSTSAWSGKPEDAFWTTTTGKIAIWKVFIWLTRQ